jgi:hypothetical protein
MTTRRHILAAALALTGLLAANTNAQDKAKGKGMTFHGKVEAVTDKGLTGNGEKVEGWMDAMTMRMDAGFVGIVKKRVEPPKIALNLRPWCLITEDSVCFLRALE